MKNHNFKILGLIAVVIFSLTACDEDVMDMNRGEGVVPSITNLDPAVFFPADVQTTYISFDIDAEGYTGDLIVLVSQDGDKSRIPVTTVSNYPATVTITLVDVAEAIGIPVTDIVPGSTFNFEVQTLIEGKTYRSPASFNAPLACEYDASNVSGAYRAASTGWGVDGPVTITVDPDDPYTLYVAGLAAITGLSEDLGPLPLIVNPGNFQVTAPKTAIATVAWIYDNFSLEGFGVVDTCTGVYEMTFTITVDQGSFGSYNFTLSPN